MAFFSELSQDEVVSQLLLTLVFVFLLSNILCDQTLLIPACLGYCPRVALASNSSVGMFS